MSGTTKPTDDTPVEDTTTELLSTSDALQTEPIPPNAEPEPSVFEVEVDRLSKENVLLKIEKERLLKEIDKEIYKTTELTHDDSVQDRLCREKEQILLLLAKPPDEDRKTLLEKLAKLDPPITIEAAHHLEELIEQKFIMKSEPVRPRRPERYDLIQRGKKYLADYKSVLG